MIGPAIAQRHGTPCPAVEFLKRRVSGPAARANLPKPEGIAGHQGSDTAKSSSASTGSVFGPLKFDNVLMTVPASYRV